MPAGPGAQRPGSIPPASTSQGVPLFPLKDSSFRKFLMSLTALWWLLLMSQSSCGGRNSHPNSLPTSHVGGKVFSHNPGPSRKGQGASAGSFWEPLPSCQGYKCALGCPTTSHSPHCNSCDPGQTSLPGWPAGPHLPTSIAGPAAPAPERVSAEEGRKEGHSVAPCLLSWCGPEFVAIPTTFWRTPKTPGKGWGGIFIERPGKGQ